jgi:HTH-type transcriptional regulator/antitoxin HigA
LATHIEQAEGKMINHEYEVPLPGMYIQEEIDARGWSQRDLAFILGIEEAALNKVIKGKTGISIEMSKALATAFDIDADFFSNLQKSFDLANSAAADPAIARRASLQTKYPAREMIKRGWIKNSKVEVLEQQLERFFRVSNDNVSPIRHVAKKTNAGDDATPIQEAWLYRVMQIAEKMECKPFSGRALSEAVLRLKGLMLDHHDLARVPKVLAECGLRFIIVEGLSGAKIDGVCFWLDATRPVVGMSLRHDRIDNFWFVLWHELAHVMNNDGKDSPIIDVELEGERASSSEGAKVSAQEQRANAYAAEKCVPAGDMLSFTARRNDFFSERDVLHFAERLRVHPGIVVGQIHNKTGKFSLLRKYLVKVREYVLPAATVDGWGHVASVTI